MRAVAALEPLRQCIDRAALLARDGSSNLIRFRLHDSMMEIESSSQLGDAHEEMPLEELQGGELTIAFNVRYMQDVVRTIDAEKIILNFNDSLSSLRHSHGRSGLMVHLLCRCARGTVDGRAGANYRRHLHRAGGGRHRHRAPERAVRGKDTARGLSPRQRLSGPVRAAAHLRRGGGRGRRGAGRAMAVLLRAPHTYTREDMAEIHCHGGEACARCARPSPAGHSALGKEGARASMSFTAAKTHLMNAIGNY